MSNMTKTMAVFAGSTCPELAEDIATALGTTLGNVKLEKFSNGEIYARYLESVRGADVFIVQSTSTPNVNEAVMELLIMADAAKRASARTVNAVVPCYGYARQDRKAAAREPITAKLVANIMTAAGIDRTITIDLHQGQIQGFFDIPVDNLLGSPIFVEHFTQKYASCHDDTMIVSPDVGSVARARAFAQKLNMPLAIVDKRRQKGQLLRGHEHHRRRPGQEGHPLRRHGGHRRLPLRRGPGPGGAGRRGGRHRLRQPRRALRPRRGAH